MSLKFRVPGKQTGVLEGLRVAAVRTVPGRGERESESVFIAAARETLAPWKHLLVISHPSQQQQQRSKEWMWPESEDKNTYYNRGT